MAKKLNYQLSKTAYIDNDVVRYSDAFKNLNATQMNLFLFLCCLAKQQYDVEKDEDSEGTSTGWSDEIRINMVDFCKTSGKKTNWYNMTIDKREAILDCYDVYRRLTNGNEKNMTLEEINKCRIKSMEMRNDDENRKIVTGLTFRMKKKPKEKALNYFDCLFDDEEIAKRLKKKAIARKNEQKLEEDKKFRRDNNTPNKKI
jgi:hypothetical protein